MAENEEIFEADIQQEATAAWIAQSTTEDRLNTTGARLAGAAHGLVDEDKDDEETPLLSRGPERPAKDVSGSNSDDTFTKPWLMFEKLPWYKRPSIWWLLPGFLPFCLAFGCIIVPRTYLVLNILCRDYLKEREASEPNFKIQPVLFGEQNDQCRDANVQALVARFQLYSTLLSAGFSALVSTYLGSLSDRIGRKKLMVYSSLGFLSETILTVIIGSHIDTISIYWLLVGSFLDGLCGSFTTGTALALAYAADCTAPDRRNVALGYFHGTLFGGIAFGPLLSGIVMKKFDSLLVPFYLAISLQGMFLLFVGLITPESVSWERQRHAREKHKLRSEEAGVLSWWNTIKSYRHASPLAVLHPTGPGTTPALRRNLGLLASIDVIMFGVAMGAMGIILLYPQYLFGWDPWQASQYVTIVNACRVTGLMVVLPTITRLGRGPARAGREASHKGADMIDIRIIRFAIFLDLLGYIGYASAMSGGMMIASGMIAALGGMGSPTLSSAITAHVSSDQTGQVLGAMSLLHAITRILSPIILNNLYSWTVGKFTPAVFCLLAFLYFVVFVLSWFLRPGSQYSLF